MEKLFKSLLLGTAAGMVAAIPMFLLGLPLPALLAGVMHWIGLGVVVAHTRLPLTGWLSGVLISLLLGLPFAMLATGAAPLDMLALLPLFAALGGLLGFGAERLIMRQHG